MTSVDKLVSLEKVIVYGASTQAGMVLPYLMSDNPARVLGIAVTDIVFEPKTISGVKVSQINDYLHFKNDAVVLIGTLEKYHQEIQEHLKELGFKNVIPLTAPQRHEMCIKSLALKHGINLDEDIIDVQGVRILNDVCGLMPHSNFLQELIDIVITPLTGDYDMVAEGPYESEGVRLQAGDIVLDCGANVGIFSAYAAAKGCYVHAFEPTTSLLRLIEKNISLNNAGGGSVYAVALSNYSGMVEFIEYPEQNQGNTINPQNRCDESSLNKVTKSEVPCITIDDFVNQQKLLRVDFIKADIEGAERLMLEGAKETLRKFSPKLAICTYHLPDDPEVLERIIIEANPRYIITHRWGKLYAFVEDV